jgi:hypothetical protein
VAAIANGAAAREAKMAALATSTAALSGTAVEVAADLATLEAAVATRHEAVASEAASLHASLSRRADGPEGTAAAAAFDEDSKGAGAVSLALEMDELGHQLSAQREALVELWETAESMRSSVDGAVTLHQLEQALEDARTTLSAEELMKREADTVRTWIRETTTSHVKEQQCATPSEVDSAVAEAVERFTADRTGLPDFALRAAGAHVVPALTSPAYTPKGQLLPTGLLHRVGLDGGVGPAEEALSHDTSIGSCFAFAGSAGALTVRLATPVVPARFTLEHVSKALCVNNCTSAPRKFRVWGRQRSPEQVAAGAAAAEGARVLLGEFEYDLHGDSAVQSFEAVPLAGDAFTPLVTLDVLSNYGNDDFTCVYRFRVHGEPMPR